MVHILLFALRAIFLEHLEIIGALDQILNGTEMNTAEYVGVVLRTLLLCHLALRRFHMDRADVISADDLRFVFDLPVGKAALQKIGRFVHILPGNQVEIQLFPKRDRVIQPARIFLLEIIGEILLLYERAYRNRVRLLVMQNCQNPLS